jgi:hypothetical protein
MCKFFVPPAAARGEKAIGGHPRAPAKGLAAPWNPARETLAHWISYMAEQLWPRTNQITRPWVIADSYK